MGTDPRSDSSEKNWRLQVELDSDGGALENLVGVFRGSPGARREMRELQASAPDDVVITHDGRLLFAYASEEAKLMATRGAIEHVLARDGFAARSVRVSHWDSELDDWRQTDPLPVSTQEKQTVAAAEHDAEVSETRTLVVNVGREIRADFDRSLLEWAHELGVQCEVLEHRHLLTSQVGFTVTGSKRKLDEFAQGLRAEEQATLRTETSVMLSPL